MADNTTQGRPAKLEDQIRDACRVRHYSLATERSYVRWYRQFVRWAGLKHPATLGSDRVEAWLSHLATERQVSASTQRQALAAILFLYRQVLGLQLPWLDNVTRAKQPQRLPRVLSQPEVRAVLEQLPRTSAGLAVALTYGTGMRKSDVLRLRPAGQHPVRCADACQTHQQRPESRQGAQGRHLRQAPVHQLRHGGRAGSAPVPATRRFRFCDRG